MVAFWFMKKRRTVWKLSMVSTRSFHARSAKTEITHREWRFRRGKIRQWNSFDAKGCVSNTHSTSCAVWAQTHWSSSEPISAPPFPSLLFFLFQSSSLTNSSLFSSLYLSFLPLSELLIQWDCILQLSNPTLILPSKFPSLPLPPPFLGVGNKTKVTKLAEILQIWFFTSGHAAAFVLSEWCHMTSSHRVMQSVKKTTSL